MAFALGTTYTEKYLCRPKFAREPIHNDIHVENENGLVYIFRGNKKSDSLNTIAICDTLENLGYSVPEDNIHIIQKKKDLLAYLNRISGHSGASCLIVIFLGEVENDYTFKMDGNNVISMREVCRPFIKSPSLKSTPKIFIFQAIMLENLVVTDACRFESPRDVVRSHNIPDEPGILIVYKKIEGAPEERLTFIKNLCKVIATNDKGYDIRTLFDGLDDGNNKLEVIKSTLTEKFYLPIMEK